MKEGNDWLIESLRSAADEVAQWPAWKKRAMRVLDYAQEADCASIPLDLEETMLENAPDFVLSVHVPVFVVKDVAKVLNVNYERYASVFTDVIRGTVGSAVSSAIELGMLGGRSVAACKFEIPTRDLVLNISCHYLVNTERSRAIAIALGILWDPSKRNGF